VVTPQWKLKNMRFGSLQITYPDVMAVLAVPPFLLLVSLRLTLPSRTPRTLILSTALAVCVHLAACLGF
jgi:hypothetical protein